MVSRVAHVRRSDGQLDRLARRADNLAASPKPKTRRSTTDWIIRTKHAENEMIKSHARGKSEMPVIQI